MILITKTELIALRDSMPLEILKEQTRKTKERNGYVDYRGIFETMGYVHAFNDTYQFVGNLLTTSETLADNVRLTKHEETN